jgi:hypothetical protein
MNSILIPVTLGLLLNLPIEEPAQNDTPEVSAQNWTCGEPKWVGDPAMNGDQFEAALENDCEITLPYNDQSLSHLNDFFTNGTKKAREIHQGPVVGEFEGLPSVYFDVTVYNKGTEEVTIRQDVQIATNLKSKLIFDMKSTSCQGTGMAEYLRFVHTRIELITGQKMKVRISNEVHVEKPWYAPEAIFVPQAKDTAIQQFGPLRTQLLDGVASHL